MDAQEIVIIPDSSELSEQFKEIAGAAKLVIFSGLPGVGKSLYIKEFSRIARQEGRKLDLVQWDVARKAFETEMISKVYPMGAGTVHNGLKLIAGAWLMSFVKDWIAKNKDNDRLLLIEAPLVGHRFVELVHKQEDKELERFLSSELTRVLVPIPTKRIRDRIEQERKRQVSEDAKVWSGAKPSVMLQLWQDTCAIANDFGMDIDLSEQVPYSPGIYEYVYATILKNRNFEALIIDEVFDIPEVDESFLHSDESFRASEEEANAIAAEIMKRYSEEEIDAVVNNWYRT